MVLCLVQIKSPVEGAVVVVEEGIFVTVNVGMAVENQDIFVTVNVFIWKSTAVNIAKSDLIWEADEEVLLRLYWTHKHFVFHKLFEWLTNERPRNEIPKNEIPGFIWHEKIIKNEINKIHYNNFIVIILYKKCLYN